MDPGLEDLVVVGLGSNLGTPEAHLDQALEALAGTLGPLRVAPLDRTVPLSPRPQPAFLNTVAIARYDPTTTPPPLALLERFKDLERRAGRRDGPRDGPRPLDLDLLLYGALRFDHRGDAEGLGALALPHPRLRRRRFVLAPLADLAPELPVPPDGVTVGELLAALGEEQGVERIPWSEPVPDGVVASV